MAVNTRSEQSVKLHQWQQIKQMEAWQEYVNIIRVLVNKAVVQLNSIKGDRTYTSINTNGTSNAKTEKFAERVARQQGRIDGLHEIEQLAEKIIKTLEGQGTEAIH